MLKLGKTAPRYCVFLEAQCCDTEVSVLLKAISMDILQKFPSLCMTCVTFDLLRPSLQVATLC